MDRAIRLAAAGFTAQTAAGTVAGTDGNVRSGPLRWKAPQPAANAAAFGGDPHNVFRTTQPDFLSNSVGR